MVRQSQMAVCLVVLLLVGIPTANSYSVVEAFDNNESVTINCNVDADCGKYLHSHCEPVSSTEAPSTSAPATTKSPSKSPVSPTSASKATSLKPTETPSSAPATTESPSKSTETPSSAPVTTESPSKSTETPSSAPATTESPSKSTETPSSAPATTESPSKSTETPSSAPATTKPPTSDKGELYASGPGQCVCDTNATHTSDKDPKICIIAANITEKCTFDEDCVDNNTMCSKEVCTCNNESMLDSTGKVCLKKLNTSCDVDDDCYNIGTSHCDGKDDDKTCKCMEDYTMDFDKCKAPYNSTCTTREGCSLEHAKCLPVSKSNSALTCQCEKGYAFDSKKCSGASVASLAVGLGMLSVIMRMVI